jgi:hypothetical protein
VSELQKPLAIDRKNMTKSIQNLREEIVDEEGGFNPKKFIDLLSFSNDGDDQG